jgi:hypothetical protein
LRSSGADPRGASGLHTHNLWHSIADPNGDSYRYSYDNCYGNCYSNGDRDRTATVYTNTKAKASSDAATSPVGSGAS